MNTLEAYLKYRDMLIEKGFSEAKRKSGRFYLMTNDKAAFIINLSYDEYCVDILYGFACTSFMGDEEWFFNDGTDSESCQVRNIASICENEDENTVKEIIEEFYSLYYSYSKDGILALKKERQKQFLGKFAAVFKPLGFKKKGARWTRDLGGSISLTFEAQKSAYSDQYYFNVILSPTIDFYKYQSYERVVMYDRDLYNWQLMSDCQINDLINYTLNNYINPLIAQYCEV